jgi:hypothetical protein
LDEAQLGDLYERHVKHLVSGCSLQDAFPDR